MIFFCLFLHHILNRIVFLEGSSKEWKEVFDTNVMGLCICTKEAVRLMKETGVDGYVIHINSIVGHFIPASLGSQLNVYPATKHAITALSEVLRLELIGSKSKIRVTVSLRRADSSAILVSRIP